MGLDLSGPTLRSYYCKRVLMERREVELSCGLCDGDGLYPGLEAIDF